MPLEESSLNALLERLLKREGGRVDHPADPGGATNYGISLRWAREILLDLDGNGTTDSDDINRLDPRAAAELYRNHFLTRPKIDALPAPLIEPVFDWAVHSGPRVAILALQREINILLKAAGRKGIPIQEDGRLGPKSLHAAENAVAWDRAALLNAYTMARCQFYQDLVRKKPANAVFIQGWLTRAAEFFTEKHCVVWDPKLQRVSYYVEETMNG